MATMIFFTNKKVVALNYGYRVFLLNLCLQFTKKFP